MVDIPGMMVPVSADDAALRRVLAQAESRVDQFVGRVDGSLRRADAAFDRLGLSASGAQQLMTALVSLRVGAGLAASLTDATKEAMEFQTAMAQVATLLKGDDASRYAAQVKDLARQFGALPTDQSKALYEVLSAGAYSAANAVEVLAAANKLAIGGVTSVKTAADGLTSVLNSYGAAAGGATDVADAFFASAAAGKTNIQELASYIGQVAPIAAQTGVSLDELLAAVAALTAGGIKTSSSMDGLRAVVAAVLKPTQDAVNTARMLGIEFNAAALKSKGFAAFLQDVTAKTGGSADALALLFGGVEALLPVMSLASQGSTAFADAQKELANKADATEAAYGKMAETAEKTADRVRAAAATYRIELGDRLLTTVQPALRGIADNFDELTGVAEKSVLALGAVAAARALPKAVQAGVQGLTRAIDDQRVALYAKAVATAQAADAEKVAAVQDLIARQGKQALAVAAAQVAQAEVGGKMAVASSATANLAAAEASLTQAKAKLVTTTNVYALNKALAAEREAELAVLMAHQASIAADAEKAASLGRLRAAQAAAAASGDAVAMANLRLTGAAEGAQAASVALAQRASLLSAAWAGLRTVGSGLLALVGGPMGAALLGGAAAVAVFAGQTTASEEATRRHEAAMRGFDDAFDRSTGKVKTMTAAVSALRRQNLESARDAAQAAVKQEETYARSGAYKIDRAAYESGLSKADAAPVFAAARALQQQFLDGALSAEDLYAGIDKLARQDERLKPLAKTFSEWAAPLTKAKSQVKEAEAALSALDGTADTAAKAVLGVGSNAASAATGFATLGGEVGGVTAKLAEMAAKAKLLEVPAGYGRRLAEVVGPEPKDGDAKDLGLWRKKRDSADATLRPIVSLEVKDQTADLARQAAGQRLLAGAVTDAAKAQAQNRVELAKVALDYPGVDEATRKALLTTTDFGAALKALPTDLQDRWAQLQASSQAQLAGAVAQGTLQLNLQSDAQRRLAEAAGQGEAATRRAAIESQVAAAAVHGLAAPTRKSLESQEASTVAGIRKDADKSILDDIRVQEALIAAYQKSPGAVRDAEIAEKAHAAALREGREGTDAYNAAKGHYVDLMAKAARLESAAAAEPMLQQQRDQLTLLAKEKDLLFASAEERAVELARTQALIDLRGKNISAMSVEGRAYIANAEAAAKLTADIEWLGKYGQIAETAFDRVGDAVTDAFTQGKAGAVSFRTVVSGALSSLAADMLKLSALTPFKNFLMGTASTAGSGLWSWIQNSLGGTYATGGGGTATAAGWEAFTGAYHSGGLVGSEATFFKGVDSSVFSSARRYHTGGLAGLAPDEVPAILRNREEVLTVDDPRHRFNLGRSGGSAEISSGAGIVIGDINVSVTGSAGTQEQNGDLARQIGREMREQVKALVVQEMRQQMRPGGLMTAPA